MSHKPSHLLKFNNLLQGWAQEYQRKEDKAELATTYTRSSHSPRPQEKIKFKKVKFWKKEGRLKYNTEFKVYPEHLVFKDSRKIFEEIPDKKLRLRDNDEISEAEDIEHAVKKGIKKLKDEMMIRKMEKIIAKREQKKEKKEMKKTKKISKEEI